MPEPARNGGSTLAFILLAVLSAAATAAYLWWLDSPGLILWNPDFLAFTQGFSPYRFYPPLYRALVALLGGGIAAGRILSATGLALAVAALMIPAIRRWKVSLPLAILGLALAFTAPHLFATALSPSVDMLYTGIALLGLATLSHLTMPLAKPDVLPARTLILQLCLCLLFLLRYHGQMLVLAMSLVMALFPGNRKVRIYGWVFTLLFLVPVLIFGRQGMNAATEQVWCGLEFRYHRLAEAGVLDGQPRGGDVNGYIWDQYDKVVRVANDISLRYHYSTGEIAAHVADNYYHYLRRPLVLMGLVLFMLGGWSVWRRRDRYLFAAFLLLYPLALSPAYYTARASLLVELAGLYLALQVIRDVSENSGKPRRILAYSAAGLLTVLALATSYPRMLHETANWRRQLSEACAVEEAMQKRDIDWHYVWTEDTSVTIRYRNPRALITDRAYRSWLDYAFSRKPPEGVVPPEDLLAEPVGRYKLLIIRDEALAAKLTATGNWEYVSRDTMPALHLLTRPLAPASLGD
ncbi:hypothetical protein J7J84_02850 [bacterium]|nr:hypothetical protein [bacterium]